MHKGKRQMRWMEVLWWWERWGCLTLWPWLIDTLRQNDICFDLESLITLALKVDYNSNAWFMSKRNKCTIIEWNLFALSLPLAFGNGRVINWSWSSVLLRNCYVCRQYADISMNYMCTATLLIVHIGLATVSFRSFLGLVGRTTNAIQPEQELHSGSNFK